MKKLHLYIASAALLALGASCSEEQFDAAGEGKLILNTAVSSDMQVVSRATEQELADNCMIWLSSEKGLVRRYNGLANVPAEIDLVTGRYIAEAWTGDSVSASFEKRWFKGSETFTVEAGATTQIDLVYKIANVAVSLDFTEAQGLEEALKDFTMTVGHDRGSLVYEGLDTRRGYFMMPSTDKNLAYELKGTQVNGQEFVLNGVIENAKPATEYILKVKYEAKTNEVGGAILTIAVEDHEINIESTVEVIGAPKISGYGFDIANPVMAEPGAMTRQTVYIASATKITAVELRSNLFSKISELGGNDFELLGMNEIGLAAINNAGINFKNNYNETADNTLFQLNFEEVFTKALEVGDYEIAIKATDVKGNVAEATLRLVVSSAPVQTLTPDADAVSYHDAVLRGQIAKDGVETAGFNYRRVGDVEWTYVEGTAVSRAFAAGDEFIATVTGLKGNSTYEYVAVSGDFVSAVAQTFSTLNDQLPNSGFEEWSEASDGSVMFSADPNNYFWDSGNHGARAMIKNVTVKETEIVHSGTAVRLASQFVGLGSIGKFAAGNIFVGKYLKTDMATTSGQIGWGRSWTLKPTAMKVWVKYHPERVKASEAKNGDKLKEGDIDQGIIYIALLDDTKKEINGEQWPIAINNSPKVMQLFSKDDANVLGYGEHVFTADTEGDGLVEITIPVTYTKEGTPANIAIVASASRYGDYFQGGQGSYMILDDIELLY